MSKLTFVASLCAAFAGGIAFVIACGNGSDGVIDAGRPADAQDCSMCEVTIPADRIYRKRNASPTPAASGQLLTGATCDPGDILIGGGCWIYAQGTVYDGSGAPDTGGQNHELIVSAPDRFVDAFGEETGTRERWICIYDNREANEFLVVDAIAICLKPDPEPPADM